jgi:hypothetical protein
MPERKVLFRQNPILYFDIKQKLCHGRNSVIEEGMVACCCLLAYWVNSPRTEREKIFHELQKAV